MAAKAAVPLREWIHWAQASLSREDYLTCAVTVGAELARHLRAATGSSGGDDDRASRLDLDVTDTVAPLRSADDVTTDSVQVVVAGNVAVSPTAESFVAVAAHVRPPPIQRSPSPIPIGVQPSSSPIHPLEALREPCSQRDVCYAFGQVLLELFTRGDPLLLIDFSPVDDQGQDSLGDLLLGDLGLGEDSSDRAVHVPPPAKRSLAEGSALSTPAANAKDYLRAQGLPVSVCMLVSDLLENKKGNEYISDKALRSIGDAHFDLMQMKSYPQRFLNDQTCPSKALENTLLFHQTDDDFYGREEEMGLLMDMIGHFGMDNFGLYDEDEGGSPKDDLWCEVAFLSGLSGSGKSSIIRQIISNCEAQDWSVIFCKFDRQSSPLSVLLHSVDSVFEEFLLQADAVDPQRKPAAQDTFDRISRSIISAIDNESFPQLCRLFPALARLFPMSMNFVEVSLAQSTSHASLAPFGSDNFNSTNVLSALGYGRNRLKYLFQIIFRSVISGGRPVLLCLEDIHWADEVTLDILTDFILTAGHDGASSFHRQAFQKGRLLYLGSYRDNEVNEAGPVMNQIEQMEDAGGNINVNRIAIGEMPEIDVNKMLSWKLCLPLRHTQELAQLVHKKTRGYPMFTIEFLRSVIQTNILTFSVRDRRWVWDETAIDMQVISDGVLSLLTNKLQHLPENVIKALMVMSCFGSQINRSMVHLLDLGQFTSGMMGGLDVALSEGIVDKAGPLLAFTHDMLQETSYNLIPIHERKPLHRKIALSLSGPEAAKDPELCILAVDQVNICKDIPGMLSPIEKAKFARLNLLAGKYSARSSGYERARVYFEAGISLLHDNHWNKQYSLSLQLYEWSVLVCFMDGNVASESVPRRLSEILSNAKTFDDKLTARTMLAKYLMSQEMYAEAINGLIELLSDLGESFPKYVTQACAIDEINATVPMLDNVTFEQMYALPKMTDARKLNVMKFLALLINMYHFPSPLFAIILSCRIIQLTFQFGFCEDTISGLTSISHYFWLYTENVDLAKRVQKVADALMRDSSNQHSLRARLVLMGLSVNAIFKPSQASPEYILDGYKSANIVGDIDNAMMCGLLWCVASFFSCSVGSLIDLQKQIRRFLLEMAKHQRIGILHSGMSIFGACEALIGNEGSCKIAHLEIKCYAELYQIAVSTHNSYLMHNVTLNQAHIDWVFRNYLSVTKLLSRTNHGAKRALDVLCLFYEGIAALTLARDTKQEKWKVIGESCIKVMGRFSNYNVWNWENKLNLLQAELHYLNKRHKMAELSYKSAILSACDHRFILEEALAMELYGIYLIEQKRVTEGWNELNHAIDKYTQYGALKKADEVKCFLRLTHLPCNIWRQCNN